MKAQILAVRGQAAEVADTLDWLETTIRESGSSQHIVFGLGSVALARAALGQNDRAAALLAEIEANPGARGRRRTTPRSCQRWCAPLSRRPTRNSRNEWWPESTPAHPLDEHALTSANAALAEAHGDHQSAAERYADAAERWRDVRRRSRAGVRPARPGPLPRRARPPDRGRPAPQPGPRHLPGATGGPGARRDRRASPTGDRAQLLSAGGPKPPFATRPRHGTQPLVRAPVARQSDFPTSGLRRSPAVTGHCLTTPPTTTKPASGAGFGLLSGEGGI